MLRVRSMAEGRAFGRCGALCDQNFPSLANNTEVSVFVKEVKVMCKPTEFDIFISYAHEDREFATELQAALGQQGWTVFMDREIPNARRWCDVLDEQHHAYGVRYRSETSREYHLIL